MEKRRDDAPAEKNTGPHGAPDPVEDLLHSPALLQALLDNSLVGIVVADSAGKIILANPAAREIMGGPVAGTAYGLEGGYELFNPDGSPISPDDLPLSRALQRGETIRSMKILVRKNVGSEIAVLAYARPVRDAAGAIAGALAILVDHTELKLTELALQKSQEELRLAQKVGHVGIFEWDPATKTGNLSKDLLSFLGLPRDYPVNIDAWSRVTPREDIHKVLENLQKAAAEHRSEAEAEYRVFRPGGEVRWLSVRGMISYDTSGRAVRVIGSAIDITDLKKAQEELTRLNEKLTDMVAERTRSLEQTARSLKNQKELLQAIIDSIPVVVTVWKPYKELVMANKEFERLSGWSEEEAKNMDVIAAAFPDPAYRKEIIRQVTKAGPGWGEFVMNTRSGKRLDILWAAADLSDGSRMGIGIDMTEQKKMESDMLRLGAAVGQAGEGIVLFSYEWTIEYVNPAFERLSGYTKEELVGKNTDFFIEHAVGDFDPGIPFETASRGNTWNGNIKMSRKSGEAVDISLTLSPVKDRAGKIVNYISINQDITHEIKLQQIMMQSQKMEAIGTLAGGIAHDLKNIFTPILINSEMAVEDMGRDSPAYPLLEEILNAARMGTDLVKQIMTFTRQTAEKKVEVDISSVVRETLSLLRSAIPKTIEIKTGIHAGNAVVQANPTQIKQVLMNLGSNAAYAMRERHGILEVDVSCVDLDEESASRISPELSSGPYVEMDVKDTGVGMDEKTLQHIFEPFFTTKLYGEGTGMGLSVVQGIVKDQGGAISVWSKPGKGSVFRILLPRLSRTCTQGAGTQ